MYIDTHCHLSSMDYESIDDVILEVEACKGRLDEIIKRKMNDRSMMLDFLSQKLISYGNHFRQLSNDIDNTLNKIRSELLHRIELNRNDINHNLYDLRVKLDFRLSDSANKLDRLATLLKAYNVENVLNRGYVIVRQNDKVVKNRKQLQNGIFNMRFADGEINAQEVK